MILYYVKELFQAIHDRYLIANNPIKYLDRIGVNHKGKYTFMEVELECLDRSHG